MLEQRGELPPNLSVHERLPGVGTVAADPRSEGLTLASNKLREIDRVAALQLANWAVGRIEGCHVDGRFARGAIGGSAAWWRETTSRSW